MFSTKLKPEWSPYHGCVIWHMPQSWPVIQNLRPVFGAAVWQRAALTWVLQQQNWAAWKRLKTLVGWCGLCLAVNSTGLPGMQGQTAELQRDQNFAADFPDESSIFLPKHGEIYESISLIPPEAPPACTHTHTPDTQSFPRFAFWICLLTFLLSPSLSRSLLPLLTRHGGTGSSPFLLTSHITRRPGAVFFLVFVVVVFFKKRKNREREKRKKEKRKECTSAQTPLPHQHARALPFAQRTSMPLILRSYFPWSEPIKDFQPLWREQFQITLDSLVNSCLPGSGSIFYLTLWSWHTRTEEKCACVCASAADSSCCASNAAAFRLQRVRENLAIHLYGTLLICNFCSDLTSL